MFRIIVSQLLILKKFHTNFSEFFQITCSLAIFFRKIFTHLKKNFRIFFNVFFVEFFSRLAHFVRIFYKLLKLFFPIA